MTPTKQTVYLPVSDFNNSERVICTIGIPDLYGDKVVEKEGYFFTQEELNTYTKNVIEQALETAAEEAIAKENSSDYGSGEIWVDEKSITNTFEETFKQFKVL